MGGGDAGGVKELADRHHDAGVVVSGVARKFPREAEDGQIERECGIMGDVQRQDVAPFLGKLLLERSGKSVLQSSAVSAGGLLGLLFALGRLRRKVRSEEHTSELQSLMRISYAVFCLKKKKTIYLN